MSAMTPREAMDHLQESMITDKTPEEVMDRLWKFANRECQKPVKVVYDSGATTMKACVNTTETEAGGAGLCPVCELSRAITAAYTRLQELLPDHFSLRFVRFGPQTMKTKEGC